MMGRAVICDGCGRAGHPAATAALARTVACAGTIRRVRLGRYGSERARRAVNREFCESCRYGPTPRLAAEILAASFPGFVIDARYVR